MEIMRSQINLNPFNPKRHSDKKVTEQKKNLQRVGYLGGITWNKTSGNLIDGHRRIKALDLYYGYDGTPATDYKVKVEVVSFNEKQEKEQMTYMALGNTKADFQLIAEYLPEIDYANAGIEDYELQQIQSFLPKIQEVQVDSIDDLIEPSEPQVKPSNEPNDEQPTITPSEKKAAVKEAKAAAKERAIENYQELNAYITISFSSAEQKRTFCELAGIDENERFVQGEDVLNLIE